MRAGKGRLKLCSHTADGVPQPTLSSPQGPNNLDGHRGPPPQPNVRRFVQPGGEAKAGDAPKSAGLEPKERVQGARSAMQASYGYANSTPPNTKIRYAFQFGSVALHFSKICKITSVGRVCEALRVLPRNISYGYWGTQRLNAPDTAKTSKASDGHEDLQSV